MATGNLWCISQKRDRPGINIGAASSRITEYLISHRWIMLRHPSLRERTNEKARYFPPLRIRLRTLAFAAAKVGLFRRDIGTGGIDRETAAVSLDLLSCLGGAGSSTAETAQISLCFFATMTRIPKMLNNPFSASL